MKAKYVFMALFALALPLQAVSGRFTISKERLMDKIKGGWAGQTIGCTYGGPTEFHYQGQIIGDNIPIEWTDGVVRRMFQTWPDLYDDLYMDLTFVDVMHREGLDAPVESHARAFADAGYNLWHANQAGRYNIHRGIMPPLSGHWKYNVHANDIDYQIEADFAGILSPAMPNTASEISDGIGHIMSYGDGWYGGVYVGAMYALAYVCDDVETIVTEALKTIPSRSKFYKCQADVVACHKAHPNDWKRAWQLVQDKYDDDLGCTDGVESSFNIDATINSAYITIGLLYGEGDFGRTLEISTRCGQDSDCNPASAGGILGCMMGYSRIPEMWMKPLREAEDLNFNYTDISLNRAYEYSMQLASENILRHGGQDLGDAFVIEVQQPKEVRYEESFPSMKVTEVRPGRWLSDFGTERFYGTGIEVAASWEGNAPDYVAEVKVYLDGRYRETVKFPCNYHERSTELFWAFDLEEGAHDLNFILRNPNSNIKINCHRVIAYTSNTADNAYRIGTAEELVAFSSLVNAGARNVNAVLTADIDMAKYSKKFKPIGTEANPFHGSFDGQGHKISNLTVNTGGDCAGLFGYVSAPCDFKNFVLDASCTISGVSYCGMIGMSVPDAIGTINLTNLGNEGNVVCTGQNNGGIIGCNMREAATFKFRNCYTTGKISGWRWCGAMSGWVGNDSNHSSFSNCWSTAEVTGYENEGNYWTFAWHNVANVNCYGSRGTQVAHFDEAEASTGALTFRLNNGAGSDVWFQTIGEDEHPVLDATHGVVHRAEDGSFYSGIENVKRNETTRPTTIYNLQGMRLQNLQQGINIVNGNLLFVK